MLYSNKQEFSINTYESRDRTFCFLGANPCTYHASSAPSIANQAWSNALCASMGRQCLRVTSFKSVAAHVQETLDAPRRSLSQPGCREEGTSCKTLRSTRASGHLGRTCTRCLTRLTQHWWSSRRQRLAQRPLHPRKREEVYTHVQVSSFVASEIRAHTHAGRLVSSIEFLSRAIMRSVNTVAFCRKASSCHGRAY